MHWFDKSWLATLVLRLCKQVECIAFSIMSFDCACICSSNSTLIPPPFVSTAGSARFAKLCGVFALLSHLFACAWYLVAGTNAVDNWVTTSGLAAAPMAQKYLLAFYYQLSTMATLSYADVWPTNTWETIVLLVAIFVAGGWFAAMAGAMETAVHHADADELRVQRQASELRAFFRSRRLPASLRERASLYLELLRSRASKGVDEKAVLGWLPANMQLDIAQFVHRDLIERVPIFRECSRGFVKSMAALLRRVWGTDAEG